MKFLKVFSLFLTFPLFLQSQSGNAVKEPSTRIKRSDDIPINYGEFLRYKVRYNLYFNINVGEVTFQVEDKPKNILGKECYHVISKGRTYGFYDPFYKVRDHYESYFSNDEILPQLFIRIINEGGYKFNERVIFNHDNNTAKNKKDEIKKIPKNTQDVVSALYFARTFDFSNAKVGDSIMLHTFIDDSAYYVGMVYMGKEKMKTEFGKINCLVLKPILIVDRIFSSDDDMTIWVTDDKNKIPVRVESGISVGSIRADLVEHRGLRYSFMGK